MSALHAALVAALDADDCEFDPECQERCDIGRRVAADRRVLTRHAPRSGGLCLFCCGLDDKNEHGWPCPDIVDLANRYDVEVPS